MPNYAVIENNIVVDIIVAENIDTATSLTGLTCVEYDENANTVGRYWEYDGKKFTNPSPPISPEQLLGIDTTGSK